MTPGTLTRLRTRMLEHTFSVHPGDLAVGAVGWIATQYLPQLSAATGWPAWPFRVVLGLLVLVLVGRALARIRTGMLAKPLRPKFTARGIVVTVVVLVVLTVSGNAEQWWLRLACMVAFSLWVVVGLPRAVARHRARVVALLGSSTRGSAGHRAPWHGIEVDAALSPVLGDADALLLCVGLEATGDAHLATVASEAGLTPERGARAKERLVEAGLVGLEPKPFGPHPRDWGRLTPEGHRTLVAHLEALDARPRRTLRATPVRAHVQAPARAPLDFP